MDKKVKITIMSIYQVVFIYWHIRLKRILKFFLKKSKLTLFVEIIPFFGEISYLKEKIAKIIAKF